MSTSPEEYGDNNLPVYTTLHITLCECECVCAHTHVYARAGSHKILLTSHQQNIQEVRNSEKKGEDDFCLLSLVRSQEGALSPCPPEVQVESAS